MSKIRILGLSGGGIRGIISAVILEEIELRTGKPIHKLFDYITATSTGGLSTLALTTPKYYKASEVVDFFVNEGPNIFKPRTKYNKVNQLLNLFTSKYTCEQRQKVLKSLLGDSLVKDSLTNVLVTSYDTELRIPIFFSNDNAQYTEDYHKVNNVKMYEAAMATSAAPSFFPPYKIKTNTTPTNYYSLVDGGLFCNNPTYLAIMNSINLGYAFDDMLVLSLGTGSLTKSYKYKEIEGWGLVNWAAPVIDMIMDSQSNTVDIFSSLAFKNDYYCFNPVLTIANDAMDDVSDSNMNNLIKQAREVISKEDEKIDKLCEGLIR